MTDFELWMSRLEAAKARARAKLDNPNSRWVESFQSNVTILGYRTRVRRVPHAADGWISVGVCRIVYQIQDGNGQSETIVSWYGIKDSFPIESIRPDELNERLADTAIASVISLCAWPDDAEQMRPLLPGG